MWRNYCLKEDYPFLTISPWTFSNCQIKICIFTFFFFENVSSLSLKQIKFCGTNYGLSSKTTTSVFFKVIQYGYKTFRNVQLVLQNHTQKQPPEAFYKKDVLKNFAKFTGKHQYQKLFFKIEALTQLFSCEFYEIFKNTLFKEHLWTAASAYS